MSNFEEKEMINHERYKKHMLRYVESNYHPNSKGILS